MAAVTSAVSQFSFDGNVIAAIGSCGISYQRQPIEITPLGFANTKFLHGIANAAISLDVFYSSTDHLDLVTAVTQAETAVPFVITFVAGDTIEGFAICVGFDAAIATNDVSRASFTLQCTGALMFIAAVAELGLDEPDPFD